MEHDFISVDEVARLFQQQDRKSSLYGEWLIETEQEKYLRERQRSNEQDMGYDERPWV